MSKGDAIEVTAVVGGTTVTRAIAASKAGRSVRQRRTSGKDGSWLVVEEMTRTRKATGSTLKVRADAVAMIRETVVDEPEPSRAKPKPVQQTLLPIEGGKSS